MKMKLGNLLVVASLLIGTSTFAQDDAERECLRMRKIANDALSFTNYKEAVEYFLKGEAICAEFGKDNYDRLISSLTRIINAEEDEAVYKAYVDTLIGAYERAEEKGFYDTGDDMRRGYFYLQGSDPQYKKADQYMKSGVEKSGSEVNEAFIPIYYYNIYTLWYIEQNAEQKQALKQRLIREYFSLSKLIQEANFAPKTQEDLTAYRGLAIKSCEDILPEVPAFMKELPVDPAVKKTMMLDMARLLKELGCAKTAEFKKLGVELYALDPNDIEVILIWLEGLDTPREKIDAYEKLLVNAKTEEEKNKYRYQIASEYFNMGSYSTAYAKAKVVGGEQKGNALSIMGQSVGKTAMSCGESTFERKCNYLYAVQLLEQAQANGASGLGGVIGSYKANYPTSEDCFDNGNPGSVTLTCWGVSVSPCK